MAKKTTAKSTTARKPTAAKPAPKAKTAKPAAKTPATKPVPKAKAEKPAPKAKETSAKPAKAKPDAPAKEKKVSCLDAAAQVLAASKTPMNCKEMIEALAAKKLWTSPGGKTPHATLYSAILREINTKGKEARFTKTERGKFAAQA